MHNQMKQKQRDREGKDLDQYAVRECHRVARGCISCVVPIILCLALCFRSTKHSEMHLLCVWDTTFNGNIITILCLVETSGRTEMKKESFSPGLCLQERLVLQTQQH